MMSQQQQQSKITNNVSLTRHNITTIIVTMLYIVFERYKKKRRALSHGLNVGKNRKALNETRRFEHYDENRQNEKKKLQQLAASHKK